MGPLNFPRQRSSARHAARKNRMDIIRPGPRRRGALRRNSFEELRARSSAYARPSCPTSRLLRRRRVDFRVRHRAMLREDSRNGYRRFGIPDFHLMFTDTVLCFDKVRQTLQNYRQRRRRGICLGQNAYQAAPFKIDEIIERLNVRRAAVPRRRE